MTQFTNPFESPAYFEQALFLYVKYLKYLDDDYASCGKNLYNYFFNLVCRTMPMFFVIVEDEQVSGFIYLDNITGYGEHLHSAEITACFDKRYWGDYTKQCAEIFLEYCFKVCNFKKIKALVYPQNFRVKPLLKKVGLEKEALLKNETLCNGQMQDIEIYSIFNNFK